MKLKTLMAASAAAFIGATPALAELVFPSLSYRTGPYAAGGIPFADGYADYFTMLNERDGGIGGVMTRVPECETAYDTTRGVECYEQVRDMSPLVLQPLSTGITYQLIPRVTEDGIPLHTMGYGRTSAADGTTFEWVFNYPGTYWDAASIIINHLLEENDGSLEGKNIMLLYHNSAYGREPIRTLQELSQKHGYSFTELAVDHPGQEQTSQWLQIRRERPDYVLMWGWGVMNQVAITEAANIRFPMENFIGVWWSGSEHDVAPAGARADGYKAINFTGVGMDFPFYDDMREYVHDRGLAAGDGSSLGNVQYNRGIYAAMLAAEAARTAQEIHGTDQITPAMMRDGMENLNIDADRLEELGMTGFGPEVSITCENHRGPGVGLMTQWNASEGTFEAITDFIEPDHDLILELIEEDAAAFRQESGIERRDCPTT
jgi:branched-chain amino acid transport system substrate-binding protein